MTAAMKICILFAVSFLRFVSADDTVVEMIDGPVDIVVGNDPDNFDVSWSDGVCYLPIKEARLGDKIVFDRFFGHNVYKMPSFEAMEDCDFREATLLASSPPYEYTISSRDAAKSSSLYFACEVASHCYGKQRFRVDLAADAATATAPRLASELPVSRFILGTSDASCEAVRRGDITPAMASRGGESSCSDPERREATADIDRPHWFRSCLGPPLTMTPGGVVNQAFVLNYPFPKDRRVLIGTRMWEFVQGDLDDLRPVEINQLYIHHIAGSVVLGNGAENVRQSEEDAAFSLPLGMLSGDDNDRMIFHVIDLRETGDQWLECLECRCPDGEGSYLGIGGSGGELSDDEDEIEEGAGGVSCCYNCTDLLTPTIDYRMRYNVTYTELSEIEEPVEPLIMISADVAPTIDRYIEWDVPMWQNMPEEHALPGNPKVQVLERVGTLRELFGGFFPGAVYTGNDLLEVHRCIGHLHIAGLGMWLYDAITGDLLCHNDVKYGDDPAADKGFLKTVTVTNYDPPLQILSDREVRLVTHYDAEILHTGVMGLIFLMVAEKDMAVGPVEAALTADVCLAPRCDVAAVLPNGGCRDALPDSILCSFGGVCSCDDLLAIKDTVGGCGGVYMSSFGNVSVASLCAEHCGCGEDILEESVLEQIEQQTEDNCHYAGEKCTRYLSNVYACAQPWAKGSEEFNDSVMAILAQNGEEMALEGTKIGDPSLHRFDTKPLTKSDVRSCDPKDYPEKSEATGVNSNTAKKNSFHPFYLFPVVVVGIIVGLGLYSHSRRKKQKIDAVAKSGSSEADKDEEVI